MVSNSSCPNDRPQGICNRTCSERLHLQKHFLFLCCCLHGVFIVGRAYLERTARHKNRKIKIQFLFKQFSCTCLCMSLASKTFKHLMRKIIETLNITHRKRPFASEEPLKHPMCFRRTFETPVVSGEPFETPGFSEDPLIRNT